MKRNNQKPKDDNKSKNNQILTLFAILLFLIPIASAITYPTLTGYVTDNANIITPEYREKITQLAEQINKNTTVEIAVLTIESLEGDSPENYALQTFRNNGVGKKDNNNGLLILVSKNDRKYRFEVGYGLEGTIPDSSKVPIGEKIITPNFRQGEYGKGIYESILVIEGLLTNNTEVLSKYGMIQASSGEGSGGSGDMGFLSFFVIIIIFLIVMLFIINLVRGKGEAHYSPPIPTTYTPPPYTFSGERSSSSSSSSGSGSSTRKSSWNSSSTSHTSHISSGGSHFGGFGGGRSGGGGFGGSW